jgi:CheY-like chemotaxis protein
MVEAPSPLPATAGEEEAVIRDKTILLVEDDAIVRNMVVTLLGNLGCRVLSAGGGPAALEIFAKTPDIDLLFTDITMPGGMTGLELATKLRETVPDLKVLYTSGYAPQAAADRRTIEHPNDFWLAKPYRFKSLKNMIIKVFGTQ